MPFASLVFSAIFMLLSIKKETKKVLQIWDWICVMGRSKYIRISRTPLDGHVSMIIVTLK